MAGFRFFDRIDAKHADSIDAELVYRLTHRDDFSLQRSRRQAAKSQTVNYRVLRTRSKLKAALIKPRWVKAWGKLPNASPQWPISSA